MKAKKLTEQAQNLLIVMEGCEVNSLIFEGCVLIQGTEILREGESLEFTSNDVAELYREYLEEEGFDNLDDFQF